ncbi:MAG: DOPA 4,5-dioxygenase family protein [Bacteriovorax sp.]
MEQSLFELIHDRGLRQIFWRCPQHFNEHFRLIFQGPILHESIGQLMQNHRNLTQAHPELYLDWQKRFPFDQLVPGLELTASFLESKEHINAHCLADNERQSSMNKCFLKFCRNFWHLVVERAEHPKKDTIDEISHFHVHFYELSFQNLYGPHPQDMKTEVFNFAELQNNMNDFLKMATVERPIFIHTLTGDDLYDHTYGALWLGRTLPLKFAALD